MEEKYLSEVLDDQESNEIIEGNLVDSELEDKDKSFVKKEKYPLKKRQIMMEIPYFLFYLGLEFTKQNTKQSSTK